MSNWACVVKAIKKQRHSNPLSVQYNIVKKDNTDKMNDAYGIPRQREVTPDPADNFTMTNTFIHRPYSQYEDEHGRIKWIDYTTNKRLKLFKESLPISVQRIIEFAQKLHKNELNIHLDLNEIENDIKHQCITHQGNKRKLKKIYHNFKKNVNYDYGYLKPDEFDVRYRMVFGDDSFTVTQYIFNEITHQFSLRATHLSERTKIINQLLSMIKLLMINNIINVSDQLWNQILYNNQCHHVGDQIKSIISEFDEYNIPFSTQIVDLAVMAFKGFNQRKSHKMFDSILKIYTNRHGNFSSHFKYRSVWNEPGQRYRRVNRVSLYRMRMSYNLVDTLLIRGVSPFRFVKDTYYGGTVIVKDTEILSHITGLVSKACTDDGGGVKEILSKMALFAPLMLKSHLCRIIGDILSQTLFDNEYIQSEHLSKEIANIISHYLSIDSYQFYEEYDAENNNLDMSCMVFLSKLLHFKIDDAFITEFKSKYVDRIFMDHLINNNSFLRIFCESLANNLSLQFLTELIAMNSNQTNKYKFPLEREGYGLYYILNEIIDSDLGPKQDIIQFFNIIKSVYNDTFDIKYDDNKLLSKLMNSLRRFKSRSYQLDTLDGIFKVFKQEIDIKDPCLFTIWLKNTRFEPLECVLNNYDEIFCIEKICEMMMKVLVTNKESEELTNWDDPTYCHRVDNKEFLEKVQKYCLDHKCSTHQERELLINTIRKVWSPYSRILRKKHRQW